MTVEDALKRIRRTGTDKETINVCYVVDPARKLQGDRARCERSSCCRRGRQPSTTSWRRNVISVHHARGPRARGADLARSTTSSPFRSIDKEDRLVGIVTVDDAIDVMEEETTEDIEKMAAIAADG